MIFWTTNNQLWVRDNDTLKLHHLSNLEIDINGESTAMFTDNDKINRVSRNADASDNLIFDADVEGINIYNLFTLNM